MKTRATITSVGEADPGRAQTPAAEGGKDEVDVITKLRLRTALLRIMCIRLFFLHNELFTQSNAARLVASYLVKRYHNWRDNDRGGKRDVLTIG